MAAYPRWTRYMQLGGLVVSSSSMIASAFITQVGHAEWREKELTNGFVALAACSDDWGLLPFCWR